MLHLIPPKGLCQNLILSPERLCPTAPLEMVMLLLSADLSYSPWVTAAPGISDHRGSRHRALNQCSLLSTNKKNQSSKLRN